METLIFDTDMLVSGIILAVTFTLIFTEQLHGIERPKVAMAGAVSMIIVGQIFGFYSPEEAIEAVDWKCNFSASRNDDYRFGHDPHWWVRLDGL